MQSFVLPPWSEKAQQNPYGPYRSSRTENALPKNDGRATFLTSNAGAATLANALALPGSGGRERGRPQDGCFHFRRFFPHQWPAHLPWARVERSPNRGPP